MEHIMNKNELLLKKLYFFGIIWKTLLTNVKFYDILLLGTYIPYQLVIGF